MEEEREEVGEKREERRKKKKIILILYASVRALQINWLRARWTVINLNQFWHGLKSPNPIKWT